MKCLKSMEDSISFKNMEDNYTKISFFISLLELVFYVGILFSGQVFLNLDSIIGPIGVIIWWIVALVLMAFVIPDIVFLLRNKKYGKLANFCIFIRGVKFGFVITVLIYFIYLNLTLSDEDWADRIDELFKYSVNKDDSDEEQVADV